jgi:hypothetical protein
VRFRNLSEQRFGRLVAKYHQFRENDTYWFCECDCGETKWVLRASLTGGWTKSCGCLEKECRKDSFGEAAYKVIFRSYINSAKARKLEFLLTDEQFRKFITSRCYYCNSEPSQISHARNLNGDFIYNGIDRLNPDIGYMIDNCVSCCKKCNYAKLAMSKEEFLDLVYKIYKNRIENENT